MPRNYVTTQKNWEETRKKVRTLQGDHQRYVNKERELLASIEVRREAMEAELTSLREAFETTVAEEVADITTAVAQTKRDYEIYSTKLRTLHEQVQGGLAEEIRHDKGALNAGLGEPNGKKPEPEAEETADLAPVPEGATPGGMDDIP